MNDSILSVLLHFWSLKAYNQYKLFPFIKLPAERTNEHTIIIFFFILSSTFLLAWLMFFCHRFYQAGTFVISLSLFFVDFVRESSIPLFLRLYSFYYYVPNLLNFKYAIIVFYKSFTIISIFYIVIISY